MRFEQKELGRVLVDVLGERVSLLSARALLHVVLRHFKYVDLLFLLEPKLGLEPAFFWLVYAGRILSPGSKKLSEYGLQNLSTIFLNERLLSRNKAQIGIDKG